MTEVERLEEKHRMINVRIKAIDTALQLLNQSVDSVPPQTVLDLAELLYNFYTNIKIK